MVSIPNMEHKNLPHEDKIMNKVQTDFKIKLSRSAKNNQRYMHKGKKSTCLQFNYLPESDDAKRKISWSSTRVQSNKLKAWKRFFSNALIIHDFISQPERPIRVRWMSLKLNETPVENH